METNISCPIKFFEKRAPFEIMCKKLQYWRGHRRQCGAWAFHAGYLRL